MNIYTNGATIQAHYDDMEIKIENTFNNKKIVKKIKKPEIQKILLICYFSGMKSINLDLI